MRKPRKDVRWPVWAMLALLLGFLGFSSGVLWEGRAKAGVFTLHASPDYMAAVPSEGAPIGLMDINSASALELTDLPGIGPVLAQRIIDYRGEHGPFTAPEELTNVKGIGDKVLSRILPYIQPLGGYE